MNPLFLKILCYFSKTTSSETNFWKKIGFNTLTFEENRRSAFSSFQIKDAKTRIYLFLNLKNVNFDNSFIAFLQQKCVLLQRNPNWKCSILKIVNMDIYFVLDQTKFLEEPFHLNRTWQSTNDRRSLKSIIPLNI